MIRANENELRAMRTLYRMPEFEAFLVFMGRVRKDEDNKLHDPRSSDCEMRGHQRSTKVLDHITSQAAESDTLLRGLQERDGGRDHAT